jgi:hypothetical protein
MRGLSIDEEKRQLAIDPQSTATWQPRMDRLISRHTITNARPESAPGNIRYRARYWHGRVPGEAREALIAMPP